jgi:uncharacterized repeat protein (TIGR01451 family)
MIVSLLRASRASALCCLLLLLAAHDALASCGEFSAMEVPAGARPSSVAIGDLDGDGDADLAVANANSNNVSILLGTGNGTFAAAVNYGGGTTPQSVAIGDLDGDGDGDLAVANTNSNDVSILLGNGNGTFAAAVNYGAGINPRSVAIGDLDGDGDADLAVASSGSGVNNVSILLGNGNGTFAAAVSFTAGSAPLAVAIGDLDGDGDADLAVANQGSNNVSILMGNGNGTFAAAVSYGTGTIPRSVAIGDLDGDGDADLAVANQGSSNVSILLGNGTFAAAVNYGAGTNPSSVAIGDLDGDGDADLAVANFISNNVSILLGNGNGTFAAAVSYGAGTNPSSVAIGDLDGDGDADLAVANFISNNVSILLSLCPLSADLMIAKFHLGDFNQGQTGATYTITATNSGSAATSGTVTITDTLPVGLTPTAPDGAVNGWTCGIASQTVTCTRSDALAASGSYPAITLTVDVAPNAGAAVTNTAGVSGGGESNPANDTASDPTTITQLSDLTIAKSHTGNFTQGQTGATYTITVTNSGSAATSGTVTVTDTLPAGLTPTAPDGAVNGWTCGIAGQTVTCTRSDALAASGSYPAITLTVDVAPNAGAAVTNTAGVSGGGESNPANDTASDPTTIAPSSDVSVLITKTASANPVADQPLTYTISASNIGSNTAASVVVTDVLPVNVTYVSVTSSQGSCSGTTTVVCTLGSLANGAQATIELQVMPTSAGPVSNTATLSTAPQFNTGAGSSSATVVVIVAPAAPSDIPTLGGWALILLAISFAFTGIFVLKR